MATTLLTNETFGARDHVVINATGTIGALNDAFGETLSLDPIQSVAVQVSGTFVGTITFQVSNDKVNWITKSMTNPTASAVTTAAAPGLWSGDLGARYFRAIFTAYTSGTATIGIYGSSQSQSSQSTTIAGTPSIANTMLGTAAGAGWKVEDAVHATGDVGMATFGVRAPTTPVAATSAAGDYGYFLIDQEGKQVISGSGAAEQTWQARIDLTTTSDVSLKAAAAAGIRNYITDVILDNSAATPARFVLKDNATAILSVSIPANSSVVVPLKTPLKGTAATVVNGALIAAGTVGVTISGFIGI
jgi:hypothetical protein